MNAVSVVDLVNTAAEGDPAGLPVRRCSALCAGLPVDGATISLLPQTYSRQFVGASDALALGLEEVQFAVGEGPCITAAVTGRPVIVPDLHTGLSPWPIFGAVVREQLPDIGALCAFPLVIEAEPAFGAMDLLSRRPFVPDRRFIEEGTRAAQAVAQVLLPSVEILLEENGLPAWEPADVIDTHWGTTHRAMGALAQRLGISADDALARIRARAFASGRSIPEISANILTLPAGQLFDDLP